MAAVDRAIDAFQAFVTDLFEQIPDRAGMPPEMVRALIGGMQKVIHKRLYRDEPEVLLELAPELCDWWLSYPPRRPPSSR